MSNDLKTIKLSGNDYAPVDERLRAFHTDNRNGAIVTEISLMGDKMIQARAIITPDVKAPERYFTGSALGFLGREKAFEKLETVAVGRALAFAGYLADGRIASREEIERFNVNEAQAEQPVSAATLERAIKLGFMLYADEWDAKSIKLAKWASLSRTNNLGELTEAEMLMVIEGIEKKMKEQK